MAVANWSSSAMTKAVLLPLILVLLAMAAAGASSTEDGPAVAESGGRFPETPVGRKLLASNVSISTILCGPGSAPNYSCKFFLPLAKNATCCNGFCFDVGSVLVDKCGSCTTRCKLGDVCCSGVCTDLLTDKNNCGACGLKCLGKGKFGICRFGFCGY